MRLSLLLTILAIAAAVHAQECYRTADARIYVPHGQAALAQRVEGIVHTEVPRLKQVVGLPGRPAVITIYAYLDTEAFHRETRTGDAVRGITVYPSGKICFDATVPLWEFHHVLTHEMVHNLIGQRLHQQVRQLPVWVNEGMAEANSSPFPYWLTRRVTVPFLGTPALPLPSLAGGSPL